MTARMHGYVSGIERLELTQELLHRDGQATLSVNLDGLEWNWHFAPTAQARKSWYAARQIARHACYVLNVERADGTGFAEYRPRDALIDTIALRWYTIFNEGVREHEKANKQTDEKNSAGDAGAIAGSAENQADLNRGGTIVIGFPQRTRDDEVLD